MSFVPHQLGLKKAQISKIIKGEPVNISYGNMGADKGDAVVHLRPQNARKLLSAYKKGKGMRLMLLPEERDMTLSKGQGIFGKEFDRFVKKTIGKKATKAIYKGLDKVAKPLVNKAVDAGAMALTAYAPEFAPAIQAGKKALKGYIDRPSEYQKNPTKELMKDVNPVGMAEDYAKGQLDEYMKGEGKPRKGTQAMRDKMAKLRAMKGAPKKGGMVRTMSAPMMMAPQPMMRRSVGRPRSAVAVGSGIAEMSLPFKQALKNNFAGLRLDNTTVGGESISKYSVNSRVRASPSEMTLSPYARMDSPAMNPFVPKTSVQAGGTASGYGGRGLYGYGLY